MLFFTHQTELSFLKLDNLVLSFETLLFTKMCES